MDKASQRTVTITYTGQLLPDATDEQLSDTRVLFLLTELLNSEQISGFSAKITDIKRDVDITPGDEEFIESAETALRNTFELILADSCDHEHDEHGNHIG